MKKILEIIQKHLPRSGDSSEGEDSKPFLEHLDDLRTMLLRCLATLACGIVITVPFAPYILDILTHPIQVLPVTPDQFLQSLKVAGAFQLTVRLCFWSGLLITLPLLLFFIAQFVFPGLTRVERRVIYRSSFFAVGLFITGVLLGYYISLPVALRVMYGMHEWLGIHPKWLVTDYVTFVLHLLIAFGLAFEMPVAVMALGKMGILNAGQLKSKRRHAAVVLLVLSMILTPPDVVTQLIMAVPLFLLYELCIHLLAAAEKRKATEAEDAGKDR